MPLVLCHAGIRLGTVPTSDAPAGGKILSGKPGLCLRAYAVSPMVCFFFKSPAKVKRLKSQSLQRAGGGTPGPSDAADPPCPVTKLLLPGLGWEGKRGAPRSGCTEPGLCVSQ